MAFVKPKYVASIGIFLMNIWTIDLSWAKLLSCSLTLWNIPEGNWTSSHRSFFIVYAEYLRPRPPEPQPPNIVIGVATQVLCDGGAQ